MKPSVVFWSAVGILTIAGTSVAAYREMEKRLWPASRSEHLPADLPPAALVEPLDAAVQTRFQHFDLIKGDFGMSRIIQESEVRGHGKLVPPPFRIAEGSNRGTYAPRMSDKVPGRWDNVRVPDDYDPVRDLQRAGWDTALAVSTRVPPKSRTVLDGLLRRKQTLRLARDPVLLTERSGGTPPQAATLSDISGELMNRTLQGKKASVRVDEWSYLARPVMAHTQECVRCHNRGLDGQPLLVGQPLAIAIYGFKRTGTLPPKTTAKQVTLHW